MAFTAKDIVDALQKAGIRMDEQESSVEEVKAAIEVLSKQLKFVRHMMRSGIDGQGKDYAGFWPNDSMAEEFGVLVSKAVGKEFRSKTMETTTGAGGGFLVPEDLAAWIIDKLRVYGKFRKNCMPVRVGARQWVPKISTDLTVYAPGEGATITASDVNFGQVKLQPIKLACLAVVNRELDEDSIVGLGEIIGMSATRSIAKKEDEIGFLGDGTDDYFGMTGIVGALLAVDANIANIEGIKVGSGNAYSELVLQDFLDTVALLDPSADEDAKWYVNKRFYYSVMYRLAAALGGTDMTQILSASKERMFAGYPVEFCHCMPYTEANSQICAILGDLKMGAYLGEARTLEIARSDDVYFATDQVGFRATERVDFNAHGVGDTSDPESIVALATAAS